MKTLFSVLKRIKWKHYAGYIAIAMACIICHITFSADANNFKLYTYMSLLGDISIYIVLAISLSLVVGFLGELSLGHAGFMCVGGYFGAVVANMLIKTDDSQSTAWVLLVAVLVGAVCAGIMGFLVGLPALRLRGDYLAIVTLAFGEIVRVVFRNLAQIKNGPFGTSDGLALKNGFLIELRYFFIVGFLFAIFTIAIVQNFIRSKHGRAITAIRDNEIAARATGVNVTKYKLLAFVVSAALAGVAGVLLTMQTGTIGYSKFTYNYSIEILIIVVLGGMGSINGSIIAATIISVLNWALTNMQGNLSDYKNIVYAIVLIVIIIYNNAPALKGFREKYNFKNLWNKLFRPKHDPARVRDDSARWDVVPTKIEMNEVLSTEIVVDTTGDNSADIGERGGTK